MDRIDRRSHQLPVPEQNELFRLQADGTVFNRGPIHEQIAELLARCTDRQVVSAEWYPRGLLSKAPDLCMYIPAYYIDLSSVNVHPPMELNGARFRDFIKRGLTLGDPTVRGELFTVPLLVVGLAPVSVTSDYVRIARLDHEQDQ